METCSNEQKPIRLAVLGGESTGKTSFISRLTLRIVHEAHYPTKNQNNWLFEFIPHSKLARAILDEQPHERLLSRTPSSEKLTPIFQSPAITPYVQLSPLSFQFFRDNYTHLKNTQKNKVPNSNVLKKTRNTTLYDYYNSSNNDSYISPEFETRVSPNRKRPETIRMSNVLPRNYIPPQYCPISIDIIDTAGFKPDMVVPFLEVSLFRNLDKSILKGLANQPRVPVSTTSLLVASGASELNGKIDGYILVYSAIPELNHHIVPEPPTYKEPTSVPIDDESNSVNTKNDLSQEDIPTGGGLSLLPVLRSCILDAWTEFRNYETGWKNGQEEDVYSLIHSLKNIWKSQESEQSKIARINKLRKFKTELDSINLDPASPDSPPPFVIICTHINAPLASPLLIQKGKQLAAQWNSSFVGVDSIDDFNIDVALSLIIRDISEKKYLLSKHHHYSQDGCHPSNKHHRDKNGVNIKSSPKASVLKKFL